jgi:hypothetical protein
MQRWWYKYLFSGCALLRRERSILQSDSAVDVGDCESLNIRFDLSEAILLVHVARDLVLGLVVTSPHGSEIAGHACRQGWCYRQGSKEVDETDS